MRAQLARQRERSDAVAAALCTRREAAELRCEDAWAHVAREAARSAALRADHVGEVSTLRGQAQALRRQLAERDTELEAATRQLEGREAELESASRQLEGRGAELEAVARQQRTIQDAAAEASAAADETARKLRAASERASALVKTNLAHSAALQGCRWMDARERATARRQLEVRTPRHCPLGGCAPCDVA